MNLAHSNCLVLSFGVNRNDRFEEDIRNRLNCVVHSFDPFSEPTKVTLIRNGRKNLTTIEIDPQRWYFHSIGITSSRKKTANKQPKLETFDEILRVVKLRGKVIDFLKIDTEGAEWDLIEELSQSNSNTLCKYVKQLGFEAHPWLNNNEYNYALVKSLETCFRLFRRDHRFFIELEKTEWQLDEFRLDLKLYRDEIDLARFLFTYGELYFVNVNFL